MLLVKLCGSEKFNSIWHYSYKLNIWTDSGFWRGIFLYNNICIAYGRNIWFWFNFLLHIWISILMDWKWPIVINNDILFFSSFFLFSCSSFFATTANSSPRIFGPRLKRIEGLSLVEQNELKGAAWFQAGIPREISLEVLSRQSPGAFLVRQSSTKPGCFALSLRVPPPAPKVAHYLILRTSRGYKIKVSK